MVGPISVITCIVKTSACISYLSITTWIIIVAVAIATIPVFISIISLIVLASASATPFISMPCVVAIAGVISLFVVGYIIYTIFILIFVTRPVVTVAILASAIATL